MIQYLNFTLTVYGFFLSQRKIENWVFFPTIQYINVQAVESISTIYHDMYSLNYNKCNVKTLHGRTCNTIRQLRDCRTLFSDKNQRTIE